MSLSSTTNATRGWRLSVAVLAVASVPSCGVVLPSDPPELTTPGLVVAVGAITCEPPDAGGRTRANGVHFASRAQLGFNNRSGDTWIIDSITISVRQRRTGLEFGHRSLTSDEVRGTPAGTNVVEPHELLNVPIEVLVFVPFSSEIRSTFELMLVGDTPPSNVLAWYVEAVVVNEQGRREVTRREFLLRDFGAGRFGDPCIA